MSETIKLTESELVECIKDVLEGIDVDANGNVTMTDKHERLVNTSSADNPTVLHDFIGDIEVWSVFQRKDDEFGDGNPLLYALKGEGKYNLINRQKLFSRLEYIVKKFFQRNTNIDITIAVPSKSKLNDYFASVVSSYCKDPKYISNLFIKMSCEEVEQYVRDEGSAFRKHYGKAYEQKYWQLRHYMNRMGETFRFHEVKDMEMRKVIEHTIKLADEFYGEHIDAINDKNILIIDDSLTLGSTIKQACKIIEAAYTPRSIAVLTLFSPLYAKNGKSLK